MKAFRATYTSRKGEMRWIGKANNWVSNKGSERTVLVIKICEPEPEENPNVVFIDDNGRLRMGEMVCFSDCQWEEKSQTRLHQLPNCPKCGGDNLEFVCDFCGWEGHVRVEIK